MNVIRFNRPVSAAFRNNLVDELLNSVWNYPLAANQKSVLPQANIYETSDDFLLELLAPGFEKDQVKISIDKNLLVIKAEVAERTNTEYLYSHVEFSANNFERKFQLSEKIDVEKIEAKFKNGVLQVRLPKKVAEKQKLIREIEIA
jgi:HSP20 family protein